MLKKIVRKKRKINVENSALDKKVDSELHVKEGSALDKVLDKREDKILNSKRKILGKF